MPKTQSRAASQRSKELVWIRDSSTSLLQTTTSATLIDFTTKLETVLGENVRNWTIERIIANCVLTVPAATAAGRSYSAFLAIDVIESEGSSQPEPFTDQRSYPWVDGRTVFADHTVSASYASPAINGLFMIDMRSKRAAHGTGKRLELFGYHDNGLGANPTLYWSYSALFRVR